MKTTRSQTPGVPAAVGPGDISQAMRPVGSKADFGVDDLRRLRIAIVAPPYLPVPPDGYWGTERVVHLIVEGMVNRGHNVTLFAAPGSETSAELKTPLTRPAALGDPSSITDDVYHTSYAFLGASEFDVVHDHTGLGPLMGALLGGPPPVVHTLHGKWTSESRRLLSLVDRQVGLVAISHSQMQSNAGAHYAGVVYNGIDLKVHPLVIQKQDYLVFVGRINDEKRPEKAIEIARMSGLPLTMIVKRSEPSEQSYWREHV